MFVTALLSLVAAGALAGQLGAREARQRIAQTLGLDATDGVHIKSISTGIGGDAVVEATFDAAFHLGKDQNGNWIVKEVRTGDRRWESIELIKTAVKKEKVARTLADMQTLANALEEFRRNKGEYVTADAGRVMIDALAPAYVKSVIRLDAWFNELEYRGGGARYRLASHGPDGKPGTGDDIVIENGSLVSGAGGL
jgi:hypothetical protein